MGTPTTYLSPSHEVSDSTFQSLQAALPALGRGCYREVYNLDGAVLKVARDSTRTSKGANLYEAKIWEKVKDTEDAKFFAAVFACASDGSWLVMERAEKGTLVDRHRDEYGSPDYSLAAGDPDTDWEKIEELDAKYELGNDMHAGNIGIRSDGSRCIIDYGSYGFVRA